MEAQQYLAKKLGYVDTSDTLAVELFMKDYYKSARRITEITNKVINKTMTELILKKTQRGFKIVNLGNGFYQYGNQLTVRKDAFKDKPENILRVFEISAYKGLKLSENTLEIIYENLYQLTPGFIKKTGYKFIKLLGSFPHSSKIVSKMLIARVLTKYIPEFADIICKYQFDFYHHYTVDEHTILALKFIDDLKLPQPPQFQSYQDVLRKIKRKDLLALAILLHDIGKGQGKNHSVVGAKMSRIICKRLGLKMDDIDTVANLVEHHL
jgi:[protein-PII] uridylyltransferase